MPAFRLSSERTSVSRGASGTPANAYHDALMHELEPPGSTLDQPTTTGSDRVCIRGRELVLTDLVDRRLRDPAHLKALRKQMATAKPFPHLVAESMFNPVLLELVREEFDLEQTTHLHALRTSHESTYRSPIRPDLGPATQLYFGVVNSGWFIEMLAFVSETSDLIPDVSLFGGGMHETRAGGAFDVHRDFDRHPHTGLLNEMVFITYLNRDWNPQWKGALELWDMNRKACVTTVLPEFGRSILMKRTPDSFHGHPHPLNPPEGLTRRSVASYYYSNPEGLEARSKRGGAVFVVRKPVDRVKSIVRMLVPPIVWAVLRRTVGH